MNPLTVEWVDKAEGDYGTAGRELRVRSNPNFDGVCFHAQQMAEKYLKAFLQEHGVVFPRSHNLIELRETIIKRGECYLILTSYVANKSALPAISDRAQQSKTFHRHRAGHTTNSARGWKGTPK